jgi:hypothetical protein
MSPFAGRLHIRGVEAASSPTVSGAPTSISFSILATCNGGTYEFYLNSTLLGTAAANPSGQCTCLPPMHTVTFNNAAQLSAAWNSSGTNSVRFRKTGNVFLSWVRADVTFINGVLKAGLFDNNGGPYSGNDLCANSYDSSNLAIDRTIAVIDQDGDTWAGASDCNDNDVARNPGAAEICSDGIDNNCDGRTDEDATTYFRDVDGDGRGDPNDSVVSCNGAPAGYTANGGDCNDTNPTIYVGAPEIADAKDNDCNGFVDDVPGGAMRVKPGYEARIVTQGGLLAGKFLAGISIDPGPGNIYVATSSSPSAGSFTLLRITPAGTISTIGTYGLSFNDRVNLEWGPDSQIYVAANNNVYKINPVTGTLTLYSSSSTSAGTRHGLEFDPQGNLIWSPESVQQFWKINPGSGNTLMGQYAADGTFNHGDSFGIQPDGNYVVYSDNCCGTGNSREFKVNSANQPPGSQFNFSYLSSTDVRALGSSYVHSNGAIDPVTGDVYTSGNGGGIGSSVILFTPGNGTSTSTTIAFVSNIGNGLRGPLGSDNRNARGVTDLDFGPRTDGNPGNSLFFLDDFNDRVYEVRLANQPPVANAGADQTIECGGQNTAVSLDGSASSDPDGAPPVTFEWSEGATSLGSGSTLNVNLPRGVHVITLKVTDDHSATDDDTVQITIQDTINPQVTAPADIVVNTGPGATQCGAVVANLGAASATDACAGALSTTPSGVPAGNFFPVGETIVTYTATDAAGNSGSATQKVKVVDNTNPSISVPANINHNNDPGQCSAVLNPGSATFTDNCSGGSVSGVRSDGSSLGDPYPKGTTTITWTATDAAGNTSSGTQTVTIVDAEKPVVTTAANIVQSTDAGLCSATVNITSATFTDNCGGGSIVGTRSDGQPLSTSYPKGTTTINWLATDASGNTDSKTQTVTINDTEKPVVTTASNIVQSTDAGQCSAIVNITAATFTDNCVGGSIVGTRNDSQPLNASYPKGTTTITWLATDASGNTDSKTQTVNINDTEKPVVTTSPNIVQSTDAGSCAATVNIVDATFADNCVGGSINGTRSDSQPLNSSYPKGTTTITWLATDASGNTDSKTQTVTINDTEKPVVTTSPDMVQSTDAGMCSATVNIVNATFTDNCAGGSINGTRSDAQPLNASYPKGITTITWLAIDAAGNTSSKTQTITINDTENPVVTTAPNIVKSTDAGMCSAIVNITAATFTDNCDGGSINGTRNDGQPLNASYPKGTTTITWLATDASGNTNSKTQTVTVNDLEKPVIVAPDIVIPTTIAGSCSTVPVNYSGLTATDNCPGMTYTPSIPSGSSFGFGTTQVLVTATDAAGNVSTKTFNVTVQKVATVSGVTVTPNTQQYSDRVTFEAQLMPDACAPAGVPATTVTFFVGSQNMGTVPLVPSGGVLKGSLNTALLEPTPYGTAPTGQMAPGPHTVTAVFGGVDSDFIVSNPTTTLTITQEDARAYYTGALFASTSSASSSSATVTLSTTVKDISAVDASDTNAGDIRNARVTFINRDTNTVIASNVPVGLVSAGDNTVGTATYNWNVNIGSADSANYTVGVIVTNYYTRNSSDDNSIVTVSRPLASNFITGGGYLVLTSSSGLYFGEVGSKNNFGFNVKYNKGGTNLQGNLNVIVRNGGRVYQIKANAMTSLSVVSNKAIFNGKGNIQDITDPLHPFSIDGNGSLQVRLTDMGQPGNTDTISITIWNKSGGLWFASNWDGTQSVEQLLGGGNVVVK